MIDGSRLGRASHITVFSYSLATVITFPSLCFPFVVKCVQTFTPANSVQMIRTCTYWLRLGERDIPFEKIGVGYLVYEGVSWNLLFE